MRPSPVARLTAFTAAGVAAWSLMAAPALAYIDPTAAGAFMQSMYVIAMSAVLFVAALPHKVAAVVRAVKAKLFGQPPAAAPAPTPDQET